MTKGDNIELTSLSLKPGPTRMRLPFVFFDILSVSGVDKFQAREILSSGEDYGEIVNEA